MVYVYAADIRNLKDPKKYPELLETMSPNDKAEIMSYRFIQKRIQYFGITLLLKEVFSRHNLPAEFNLTDFNKTSLLNKFYISFSASQNLIICTISERKIGCAIKKIKEAPQNIPSTCFSKLERNYLKSFPSEYYNEEYFRLYAMKESFIKMTGEEIPNPAKVFEIVIGEDIEIIRNDYIQNCTIEEYYIPGYQLSICSEDSKFAPEITFISLL